MGATDFPITQSCCMLCEHHANEEQHAFRGGYRLEEHLLTAETFAAKMREQNLAIWAVSLDLSKAFDRVDWQSLWQALRANGISSHMIWVLQTLYQKQSGQVQGKTEISREFDMLAGVRQGCVLSPRAKSRFCEAGPIT